jgi:8-oxo-dGTP pyrophosphatase MutT (NUDIX family)
MSNMIERVRAVLVTPAGTMLAIRRNRPGQPVYWVLPGGHVDPGDADAEAALRREIAEEIAGEPQIVSLLHILANTDERQYFYLARINSWSFDDPTGPEFSEPGRGTYQLEEIPLTPDGLSTVNLKPAPLAELLLEVVSAGRDLFTMPDLRQSPAAS